MSQIQLDKELESLGLIRPSSRKEDKLSSGIIRRNSQASGPQFEIVDEETDATRDASDSTDENDSDVSICMDKVMTVTEIVYDEQVREHS